MPDVEQQIRSAWLGRISGCQLGKPVERLSMREGYSTLHGYLDRKGNLPLRDYIDYEEGLDLDQRCCRGFLQRSEPDDDINYSVLALVMLESHGAELSTSDVARTWMRLLPVAQTYTAERAAYKILLEKGKEWFPETGDAGFDLDECADNPYNDWIGAQIRADVYGWVCPGNPALAAKLAGADAALSHREDGIYGAVFVAALGAALMTMSPEDALEAALETIPADSRAAEAVRLGAELAGNGEGDAAIREKYEGLSPVHTINNLAVVVWALYSHLDDFGAAIGDAVAAGWDTDCNGATVGGLWGLQGKDIPAHWTDPWQGRVGLSLAGFDEVDVDELIERTVSLAGSLA